MNNCQWFDEVTKKEYAVVDESKNRKKHFIGMRCELWDAVCADKGRTAEAMEALVLKTLRECVDRFTEQLKANFPDEDNFPIAFGSWTRMPSQFGSYTICYLKEEDI